MKSDHPEIFWGGCMLNFRKTNTGELLAKYLHKKVDHNFDKTCGLKLENRVRNCWMEFGGEFLIRHVKHVEERTGQKIQVSEFSQLIKKLRIKNEKEFQTFCSNIEKTRKILTKSKFHTKEKWAVLSFFELPLERFFLNYARNFYQLEDTEENLQKIVNHCEKFKRKEEKVYWGSVSLYKKVKKQLDSATLFREHDFYEFMELIYSLGPNFERKFKGLLETLGKDLSTLMHQIDEDYVEKVAGYRELLEKTNILLSKFKWLQDCPSVNGIQCIPPWSHISLEGYSEKIENLQNLVSRIEKYSASSLVLQDPNELLFFDKVYSLKLNKQMKLDLLSKWNNSNSKQRKAIVVSFVGATNQGKSFFARELILHSNEMPEVNLRNENPMTSNVHYYLSNFRYLHDHPVHIKQHVNDILYSTSRESTNSNLSPISYNSLHGIPISEYIYSWGKSSTQVMILDTESTSLESKPMTLHYSDHDPKLRRDAINNTASRVIYMVSDCIVFVSKLSDPNELYASALAFTQRAVQKSTNAIKPKLLILSTCTTIHILKPFVDLLEQKTIIYKYYNSVDIFFIPDWNQDPVLFEVQLALFKEVLARNLTFQSDSKDRLRRGISPQGWVEKLDKIVKKIWGVIDLSSLELTPDSLLPQVSRTLYFCRQMMLHLKQTQVFSYKLFLMLWEFCINFLATQLYYHEDMGVIKEECLRSLRACLIKELSSISGSEGSHSSSAMKELLELPTILKDSERLETALDSLKNNNFAKFMEYVFPKYIKRLIPNYTSTSVYCFLCLERYKDTLFECGHALCNECYTSKLPKNFGCPICKKNTVPVPFNYLTSDDGKFSPSQIQKILLDRPQDFVSPLNTCSILGKFNPNSTSEIKLILANTGMSKSFQHFSNAIRKATSYIAAIKAVHVIQEKDINITIDIVSDFDIAVFRILYIEAPVKPDFFKTASILTVRLGRKPQDLDSYLSINVDQSPISWYCLFTDWKNPHASSSNPYLLFEEKIMRFTQDFSEDKNFFIDLIAILLFASLLPSYLILEGRDIYSTPEAIIQCIKNSIFPIFFRANAKLMNSKEILHIINQHKIRIENQMIAHFEKAVALSNDYGLPLELYYAYYMIMSKIDLKIAYSIQERYLCCICMQPAVLKKSLIWPNCNHILCQSCHSDYKTTSDCIPDILPFTCHTCGEFAHQLFDKWILQHLLDQPSIVCKLTPLLQRSVSEYIEVYNKILPSNITYVDSEIVRKPNIFLCNHTIPGIPNKKIIVKKFLPPVNWEQVWLEISIGSIVRHPNIVKFYGVYVPPVREANFDEKDDSKVPFIAMEPYENILSELVTVKSPHLSIMAVIKWCKEIGSCMEHLFQLNICHRAIEPKNIMLTGIVNDDPTALSAKLLNFSKAHLGSAMGRVGSHAFIAPELNLGDQPIDGIAADIYSFGRMVMLLVNKSLLPPHFYGEFHRLFFTESHEKCSIEFLRSFEISSVKSLILLIEDCTRFDPKQRPQISDVVQKLALLYSKKQFGVSIESRSKSNEIPHFINYFFDRLSKPDISYSAISKPSCLYTRTKNRMKDLIDLGVERICDDVILKYIEEERPFIVGLADNQIEHELGTIIVALLRVYLTDLPTALIPSTMADLLVTIHNREMDEDQCALEIRSTIELLDQKNQTLLFKIIQLLGNTCDTFKETLLASDFKDVQVLCCSLWGSNIFGNSKYQNDLRNTLTSLSEMLRLMIVYRAQIFHTKYLHTSNPGMLMGVPIKSNGCLLFVNNNVELIIKSVRTRVGNNVIVIPLKSTEKFKEWLTSNEQVAKELLREGRLRVVTNKSRLGDGEERAGELLIEWVKASKFGSVPILLTVAKQEELNSSVADVNKGIYVSTELVDNFIRFHSINISCIRESYESGKVSFDKIIEKWLPPGLVDEEERTKPHSLASPRTLQKTKNTRNHPHPSLKDIIKLRSFDVSTYNSNKTFTLQQINYTIQLNQSKFEEEEKLNKLNLKNSTMALRGSIDKIHFDTKRILRRESISGPPVNIEAINAQIRPVTARVERKTYKDINPTFKNHPKKRNEKGSAQKTISKNNTQPLIVDNTEENTHIEDITQTGDYNQTFSGNHNHTQDNTQTYSEDNIQTPSEDNTQTLSEDNNQTYSEDNTQTYSEENTQTYSEDNTQTYSANNIQTYSEDNTQTYTGDYTQTYSEDYTQTYSEENGDLNYGEDIQTENYTPTYNEDNTQTYSEDNIQSYSEDNTQSYSEDYTQTYSEDNTTSDNTQTADDDQSIDDSLHQPAGRMQSYDSDTYSSIEKIGSSDEFINSFEPVNQIETTQQTECDHTEYDQTEVTQTETEFDQSEFDQSEFDQSEFDHKPKKQKSKRIHDRHSAQDHFSKLPSLSNMPIRPLPKIPSIPKIPLNEKDVDLSFKRKSRREKSKPKTRSRGLSITLNLPEEYPDTQKPELGKRKQSWSHVKLKKAPIVYDDQNNIIAIRIDLIDNYLLYAFRKDHAFTDLFFITYRAFLDPHVLLRKIVENIKHSNHSKLSLISLWVSRDWSVFDYPMCRTLMGYFDTMRIDNEDLKQANELKNLIISQLVEQVNTRHCLALSPLMSKEKFTTGILHLENTQIAQQLIICCHSIYSKIQPKEFINCNWSKDSTSFLSPYLLEMSKYFNVISNWAITNVLQPSNPTDRAVVLGRFVQIAKILLDYQDFTSLEAMLVGIGSFVLTRLKQTMTRFNLNTPKAKKLQTTLEELSNLMKTDYNFEAYRNHIKTLKAPCIPLMLPYLSDIMHESDRIPKIPTQLPRENGLVNWLRHKTIGAIVENALQYQGHDYNFEKIEGFYEALLVETIQDENKLWNLSVEKEPRVD